MAARKFYVNCREQGIKLTMQDARELRAKWIATFDEMTEHMQPTEIHDTKMSQYGKKDTAEDDEEAAMESEETGDQLYKSVLVNGMVRNRCRYCAALNYQFQGLAAYGVKLAMWNIAMAGYLDRLVNMIHSYLSESKRK